MAAGLKRNLATTFVLQSPYTSSNHTLQDATWNSPELLPDTGMVALNDAWSQSKGLPPAQRFPWDHSKGLYLLNGFHNMHCLVSQTTPQKPKSSHRQTLINLPKHILRRYALETFANTEPTSHPDHIIHCLNVLREEVMCNADDTPRYTGRLNAEANAKQPASGIGQVKMCRDWEQLRRWAVDHSACYRAIHAGEEGFPPIERYKFCPGGERPWE